MRLVGTTKFDHPKAIRYRTHWNAAKIEARSIR